MAMGQVSRPSQARNTAQTPIPLPVQPQIPARAHDRRLEVADGHGGWRPFYVKGVNLGAALPGRYPSEFPDRATYDGWLMEMAEAGINTIRVYTIHPPAFYEALRAHNLRARKPLWLIHGVWAEPPPRHDFQDPAWLAAWHREMREVVEVLHGRARIPVRPGHSDGTYGADVSPWTLAIILGREWESSSVVAFNRVHPGTSDWSGRFVTLRDGQAMERFLAQSMDLFLGLEWDQFHAQRPIAFTNWPTLDPLFHITEATEGEERALRQKLGMAVEALNHEPEDEDAASLDMEKFDGTPGLLAGLFACYHAYPVLSRLHEPGSRLRTGQGSPGPQQLCGVPRRAGEAPCPPPRAHRGIWSALVPRGRALAGPRSDPRRPERTRTGRAGCPAPARHLRHRLRGGRAVRLDRRMVQEELADPALRASLRSEAALVQRHGCRGELRAHRLSAPAPRAPPSSSTARPGTGPGSRSTSKAAATP